MNHIIFISVQRLLKIDSCSASKGYVDKLAS